MSFRTYPKVLQNFSFSSFFRKHQIFFLFITWFKSQRAEKIKIRKKMKKNIQQNLEGQILLSLKRNLKF